MRRFSLRFGSTQQEDGFLQHSAGRLLSGTAWSASALLALNLMHLLAVLLNDGSRSPLWQIRRWSTLAAAILCIMSLALLIGAKMPRVHKRISLRQREAFIVFFSIFAMAQYVFTNPGFLARLHDLEGCNFPGQDAVCPPPSAVIALILNIFVMVTHISMTIRWIVVLFVEVAGIAFYSIAWLAMGSDDWILLLLFVVATFLTGFGKRQLEYTERLLFLQFLSEQQLRAEAEFQLSRTQQKRPPKPEDANSVVSSGYLCREPLDLEPLAKIGRREQWLLDAADLSVDMTAPLLGVGGFGIVASGRLHKMPVAIKLLQQNCMASLADLGNELRILRKLRHPNVVLFHGSCVDVQCRDLAVVLEYVFGQPLEEFVLQRQSGVDDMEADLQLMLGTCCALVYLHSRSPPVCHGDLKATNILVERRHHGLHPKLLDFGLARVLTKQAKPLGGSLHWAAPEVFRGSEPHPAADVFSFGRVMFFILVRKMPLADQERSAIQRAGGKLVALPLAWPEDQELSELADRYKPLVERICTSEAQSRPTIEDVYCELEKPANNNVSGQFWENIRHLRFEVGCNRHFDPEKRQEQLQRKEKRLEMSNDSEAVAVGSSSKVSEVVALGSSSKVSEAVAVGSSSNVSEAVAVGSSSNVSEAVAVGSRSLQPVRKAAIERL